MKAEHFKKAKQIEAQIKEINHIISGLETQSFYKIAMLNIDKDKTKELFAHPRS